LTTKVVPTENKICKNHKNKPKTNSVVIFNKGQVIIAHILNKV